MRKGYFQLRLDEAIALLGYSYSGRAVSSVDAAVWAINDRRSQFEQLCIQRWVTEVPRTSRVLGCIITRCWLDFRGTQREHGSTRGTCRTSWGSGTLPRTQA